MITPHIGRVELFKTSGHWQKYKDDLFPMMGAGEDEGFVLKAMNCPFHIQIYKSTLRSLIGNSPPCGWQSSGTVYRYEQSGELGGLTRVRGFTQDDAHLFVTPEQLDDEFLKVVDLIQATLRALKLDKSFRARLSFRDPDSDKYIGSEDAWNKAEAAIRRAVETLGMNHF